MGRNLNLKFTATPIEWVDTKDCLDAVENRYDRYISCSCRESYHVSSAIQPTEWLQ